MAKTRTTITIDEEIWRAIKAKAARLGRSEHELIEEAVARSLSSDSLDSLWSKRDLGSDEALRLALEAQRSVRLADL